VDELGKRYGQRPSSFLGVDDEWAAYQLDVAALTLGRWVDAKLSERDKAGRPTHRLLDLLAEKKGKDQGAGQFRSVGHLVTTKMKIPASGVW